MIGPRMCPISRISRNLYDKQMRLGNAAPTIAAAKASTRLFIFFLSSRGGVVLLLRVSPPHAPVCRSPPTSAPPTPLKFHPPELTSSLSLHLSSTLPYAPTDYFFFHPRHSGDISFSRPSILIPVLSRLQPR